MSLKGLFLWKKKNKNKKQEHVAESNVLIISSSAKELWKVVEILGKKYESNIDSPILLDNGDFAIVVKEKN